MRPRPLLALQLFLRASRVQKKRAILTVAAIAWGSLSLVLLLAFGEGLRRQMELARAGMGSGIAVLWPGQTTRPWQGLPAGRPVRPRIDDLALLRERVEGLSGICGEITNWGVAMTYGRRTVNGRVTGVSVEYGDLRNHVARRGGRFLDAWDERLRRRVAFLGDELAKDIFHDEEPVGRTLLLDNVPYTIVGVLQHRMQMGTYGGPDASHAVIPLSTYRAQYGTDRLANLVVRPDAPQHMAPLLKRVRAVLAGRYRFDPQDDRALGTWDTVDGAKELRNMLLGIQLFLGIIGGLTLVVGGVGVANIMYAVVRERTREIGVQMALGARPGWITGPIVLEGLTYTILGGTIGLLMATLVIALLGLVPTEGNEALNMLGKPTLSPAIALATAAILGSAGLLAGWFPARRAAAVDPAETLRFE